jgi:hypothetical protein
MTIDAKAAAAVKEARKALICLRLAVEDTIAYDVEQKVANAFDALAALPAPATIADWLRAVPVEVIEEARLCMVAAINELQRKHHRKPRPVEDERRIAEAQMDALIRHAEGKSKYRAAAEFYDEAATEGQYVGKTDELAEGDDQKHQ